MHHADGGASGPANGEGYVKFSLEWTRGPSGIPEQLHTELERWRKELWERELIGAYPDGIGFGNMSVRTDRADGRPRREEDGVTFFVTGSATGGKPSLEPNDYALVTACSLERNWLACRGGRKASSESLSHAAVYLARPGVGAVVHVHAATLWRRLLERYPTTAAGIEYGTPQMAHAMKEIARSQAADNGLIVMGGHEDGLLSYGVELQTAARIIVDLADERDQARP
jgi:ribulose-5-phosphate 4-epimerase/fuculose-1-phosphate aldolase